MAKSKMLEGIKVTLELVKEGTYVIQNGELFNKAGVRLGRVGKDSGNVFYVVKGYHILAGRLMYAYYNGNTADVLKEDSVITYIDGNKQNNRKGNVVQLPRKGMKQALKALRTGLCCPLVVSAPNTATAPTAYTEAQLQARRIMELLLAGKTVKEVAMEYDIKTQKVRDIIRGKSSGKATADLRAEFDAM
ncbi:hypothetical protein CN383_00145 [Priestia megaterium]|uniref:hypothetical protein n=1 Tax=Priestia megaterium TaxID=1404 RepID=UPI000BF90B7A|nr:hypothetical protein [Priestia megaterium]PFB07264.1 hypothetical protein CN383_00145 [Priestia megaterium]